MSMMMGPNPRQFWTVIFVAVFCVCAVSACGDDDDDDGRGDVYVPPSDDDLNDDFDDDDDDDLNDDSTNDDADDDTDDDADDDTDDDLDDDTTDDDTDDDVNDDIDDDTTDDDVDITWILIPAGEFMMGCSPGDDLCSSSEVLRHRVILTQDFFMTETEITQEQYEIVIGNNPSTYPDCLQCAVDLVDWDETNAFCEAIEGRLPTEAQWEYAARAGTTTRFYCGDDWDCVDDMAWYSSELNELDRAQPVRQKQPNAFGLYDMSGNVFEMVIDEWDPYYFEDRPDPDIDPQGPIPTGSGIRVGKGGGWRYANRQWVRSSSRAGYSELLYNASIGFRCVQDK